MEFQYETQVETTLSTLDYSLAAFEEGSSLDSKRASRLRRSSLLSVGSGSSSSLSMVPCSTSGSTGVGSTFTSTFTAEGLAVSVFGTCELAGGDDVAVSLVVALVVGVVGGAVNIAGPGGN